MMLNPYNETIPLESQCYEIKEKIDELLSPDYESKADKRQDKSIEKIQKILKLLEETKANKESVNSAITALINDIYENFYTKPQSDELFFRPRIFVESLPREGKDNVLYLLERANEKGEKYYEKFVFVDESYIPLGTTDNARKSDLENLAEAVNSIEAEIQNFVTGSEFLSGITEIYSTIDEVASGVAEAFEYITDIEDELSGVTDNISTILEHEEHLDNQIENINTFLEEAASPVEFAVLTDRLGVLEDKVEDLMVKGLPETTLTGNVTSSVDILVSGPIQVSSKITAPSITIRNSTVSNNARLSLVSEEEIVLKSTSFEGDFGRRQGGNTIVSLNTPDDVTVKHINFSTPATGTTYNAIEIGLTKQPKNILIENCVLYDKFENIPIIIYGVQNDAVININNVQFGRVSNCIRFSNSLNATGVTFNITNCSCAQWNIDDDWSGMFLFEDYTSSASAVAENNLFSPEKVKINISNFKYKDEKIEMPADLAEICGTRNYATQIFYIWNDKESFVPYTHERYPDIRIF